jgi:cysteine desulfurase
LAASSPSLHIAERVLRGGGQERGLRAGTENAPGVAGFGAAAREARLQGAAEAARMARLRDRLEAGLRELAPDVVIFSSGVERLPNTTLFALPGQAAETALIAFDLDGVALSSGSACSSGKVRRSHVLQAMGVSDDLAGGAVRVSLGWSSVEADVERFLKAFEKLRDALHLRQGRRAA